MLERLKQQVSAFSKARRWYIAYSGGLDSHTLLHALVQLKSQDDSLPELIAVHVNHQLQTQADHWEVHCQKQATDLAVDYQSFKVELKGKGNIEAKAREARYQVFSDLLQSDDCVFLAHHQQDQIETFFYRLFRGAGLKGLASVRKERSLGEGCLVRPMLELSREDIAAYSQKYHLNYIQDPSNDDTTFDRNYIRHQLLPVIQQRWPAYLTSVQRAINHSQESVALLDDLAQQDLSVFEKSSDIELEPWLGLHQFDAYSLRRQKNLLRFWLEIFQLQLSERQLLELIHNVIAASDDAAPQLMIGGRVLRRFKQRIYITDSDSALGFDAFEWSTETPCDIPGYGILTLSKPVKLKLIISPREGGEVIKPAGGNQTRKLKTLLQEMEVPPWRRQCLPLIYHGEELIAVADLILSGNAKTLLQGSRIICSYSSS